MNAPIPLNFDWQHDAAFLPKGIVHLPKIYMGAPYSQTIRVKNIDDDEYRDFSGFDEIRMQVRTAPDKAALLTLTKTGGNFVGDADSLTIQFPAAATESITGRFSLSPSLPEMRAFYDIEFIVGGVVVERFAQGACVIVSNMARAT